MPAATTSQPWFKQRKTIVIGLLLFTLGLALLFKFLTPATPESNVNSWQGVVPGKTNADAALQKLGQPAKVIQTDRGTTMQYTSAFPALPNEVLVDSQGRVEFIKEYLTHNANQNLAEYTKQFGQPDSVLFAPQVGPGVQASVFLKQGLVIFSHPDDQAVEQKWYFAPTTEDTFMTAWGKELDPRDEPPHPLIVQ